MHAKLVCFVAALLCGCMMDQPELLEQCREGEAATWSQARTHVALNAYYLQEEAARAVRKSQLPPAVVDEVFSKARELGATVIRSNGHNDAPAKAGDTAIQVDALKYDELSLQGLDWVLSLAKQHDVKLILTLGNYWDAYGGARQYVQWAGFARAAEGDARFFTEPSAKHLYKSYIQMLLSRVNTIDGIRYGAHPAVLAWELLNEPRGTGLDAEGKHLRAWVDEMAQHAKSYTGAWVGVGEEGFDTSLRGYSDFWRSQGAAWLFRQRSSFTSNTASPYIDYGSVHWYPEAWGFSKSRISEAGSRWFCEHKLLAERLGKPLVVGEFGLRNFGGMFNLDERRDIYRTWLKDAQQMRLAVAAPWLFVPDGRPDAWDAYSFYYRDGSAPEDPANRYADVIQEAAAK